MNSALRCKDPVVVLEHVDLYASTGEGPVDDLDYCIPVGKAAVRRTGSQITVISYLAMTGYVLQAVESLGVIDAEVIDLRGRHPHGKHHGDGTTWTDHPPGRGSGDCTSCRHTVRRQDGVPS